MSSVASLRYFITLLSRSATPHVKLCVGFGRCLYCSTQGADAVVHMSFSPGVLFWKYAWFVTLCVDRPSLDFRGFALNFICSMQRLFFLLRHKLLHELHVGCKLPLKALQSLTPVATCAAQQSENSLVAAARSSHEQSRSSCRWT